MRRARTFWTAALAVMLAAGAAEAQTARQSWTSDRRDFGPGDVITILIDEYTLAASNQGEYASDRRFRDLGVGVGQSVSSAAPGGSAEVTSSNQSESRRSGEATRQNRFQGEMTVRVLSVEEGGLLRVEGRKVVNIDRSSEELLLRGLIRPQDISASNTIDSWRVADAELLYSSQGVTPRGGILTRILGAIWP